MAYARGPRVEEDDADDLAHAVRLAEELGADVIKTGYSGDAGSFDRVAAASAKPVIIAGGSRGTDRETVEMVRGAMDGGAAGVSMGRSIFQHDDPARGRRGDPRRRERRGGARTGGAGRSLRIGISELRGVWLVSPTIPRPNRRHRYCDHLESPVLPDRRKDLESSALSRWSQKSRSCSFERRIRGVVTELTRRSETYREPPRSSPGDECRRS
jgi:hypothetical protein